MVNMHHGIYHYTHLLLSYFRSCLIQKLMDTVLQSIPYVICYLDDIILVTGSNDKDHLS